MDAHRGADGDSRDRRTRPPRHPARRRTLPSSHAYNRIYRPHTGVCAGISCRVEVVYHCRARSTVSNFGDDSTCADGDARAGGGVGGIAADAEVEGCRQGRNRARVVVRGGRFVMSPDLCCNVIVSCPYPCMRANAMYVAKGCSVSVMRLGVRRRNV